MLKYFIQIQLLIYIKGKYMTHYIAGDSNDGPVERTMISIEHSASELLDKDFSIDSFLLLF